MITVPDSHKSAKRHDRVRDVTALLVDHQIVNRAYPIAAGVEDVRALDFVRGR
jgi:hypothetical protein